MTLSDEEIAELKEMFELFDPLSTGASIVEPTRVLYEIKRTQKKRNTKKNKIQLQCPKTRTVLYVSRS